MSDRADTSSPSTSSPLNVALPRNVEFRQGDAFALAEEELGVYDVVLSDMAPSTTGNRFADQARSFELFMRALAVAESRVETGRRVRRENLHGRGPARRAREGRASSYEKERLIRPEGHAQQSYEIFVIGRAADE